MAAEIHSQTIKHETTSGQIDPLLTREVISIKQVYPHLTCQAISNEHFLHTLPLQRLCL